MLKYWKYLEYLFKLKDISEIYKEENSTEKPWYLSKRFIGAVLTFIFSALSLGLTEADVAALTDQIILVSSAVPTIYGLIMLIKGIFDKIKRRKENVTTA